MPNLQNAVAKREEQAPPGAGALVAQYKQDFTTVLPSHIRADTWVRVAQGALKRGRKYDGDRSGRTELEVAATNNPSAFLSAMLDAARLGLEPGTEAFYLTPRKVKGRLEILGIIGYQGLIDLMYRSGFVTSVVAEVVREKDSYRYKHGRDRVPEHDFPSFAGEKQRGKIIGVYAYAEMINGSVSRVIELDQDQIEKIKKESQGADSQYSPWTKWEEAMWLKSSVRALSKWVPTSAERISTLTDSMKIEAERLGEVPTTLTPPGGLDEHWVTYDQTADGEIQDAELVDTDTGEVVPQDSGDWPTTAKPGSR